MTTIDLSRLPPPAAITTFNYEALLQQRLLDFRTIAEKSGYPYNVEGQRTDPVVIGAQVSAYHELLLRQRVNDAVAAVLVASSAGSDLDQIAADLNVTRLLLDPGDPAASPPVPEVREDDARLRDRRILAVGAMSVGGPQDAYAYHVLSMRDADDVALVWSVGVYSHDERHPVTGGLRTVTQNDWVAELRGSTAGPWLIANGDGTYSVPPGHVHVVVLPNPATAVAGAPLLADVSATVGSERIRPVADYVHTIAASLVNYSIAVTVHVPRGPDREAVRAEAERRLGIYAADQTVVGGAVDTTIIAAVAALTDQTGRAVARDVTITSPVADVVAGPYGAPRCTGITVDVEVVS